MTLREWPWARFGGAARRAHGMIVMLFPMVAAPLLHHALPDTTVTPTSAASPSPGGPGPVSRPARPLSTARIRGHIGNVPRFAASASRDARSRARTVPKRLSRIEEEDFS